MVPLRNAFVDLGPLRTVPLYRRLWFGQTVSGLGSQMTMVAVLFQVWETTASTVWTGAVGMAHALPLIVFGLFLGSLVDRADRRWLYLTAMTGQAVCSLLLAAQAFLLDLPVGGLPALVAVQGGFGAVGAPAARTFLPRLLAPEHMAAGLALTRIGFQGSMLAGPALGGIVLAGGGVGACYVVDAVTFCAALWGAFGLPATAPSRGTQGLRGVLEGLTFLVSTPMVRAALLTTSPRRSCPCRSACSRWSTRNVSGTTRARSACSCPPSPSAVSWRRCCRAPSPGGPVRAW